MALNEIVFLQDRHHVEGYEPVTVVGRRAISAAPQKLSTPVRPPATTTPARPTTSTDEQTPPTPPPKPPRNPVSEEQQQKQQPQQNLLLPPFAKHHHKNEGKTFLGKYFQLNGIF